MTESAPLISAERLSKVYRLYSKPQHRFLDMIGMLPRNAAISEHRALDDVTFAIGRGERVGIIGRNGAGKSTLLKLISGVITPTSGSLDVHGSARALLELGTGFHPEFTGRQNAEAYLAQLGIGGARATELIENVVDFAELEEYIDQPMKTYSSGMAVRLMFSTSTVVAPELLILDEVLGVGDAYFNRKSFDRIQELCDRDGATLLLVSHDIYTSARICQRMIWLERGRVVFDGDPQTAIRAYEESIREQEEHRLRKKALLAVERSGRHARTLGGGVYLELRTVGHLPPPAPVYIARFAVSGEDGRAVEMPLSVDAGDDQAAPVTEATNWGDETEWQGVHAREMRAFGSPFQKVAAVFMPEHLEAALRAGALTAQFRLGSDEPCQLETRAFAHGVETASQPITLPAGGWTDVELTFGHSDPRNQTIEPSSIYGNGAIELLGCRMLDYDGTETFLLLHGAPARLQLDYRIRDGALRGPCDINISLMRGGVETACRVFTRSLHFDGSAQPEGTIEVRLGRLGLGTGEYSLNVMIAREGYFQADSGVFFSVHPDVFVCVNGMLDFTVKATDLIPHATAYVEEGDWRLLPPTFAQDGR